MVVSREEIEQHYLQEEHLFLHVISSLLGAFILIFILFVLIYAPGKTIAKYGTVVDIHDYGISQKEDSTHVHVLLDDGKLVTVSKPDWFDLFKNKKVILQETPSILGRVKRYSLYQVREQQP